jgi:hypothetical protein
MRQLGATALLIGNGVFLFVGLSDLIFVVSGWASDFGVRSAAAFGAFAGPLAIALPLLAVLIATHIAPTVPQARTIVMAALGSYGVSAFFGLITYLGAFAGDLFSIRATFDGLLVRTVWLAFLTVAAMTVYRIYRSTYPSTPSKAAYSYGPTMYGRPYPGQPMYPQPTYKTGSAEPNYERIHEPASFDGPTAETGWPAVPLQPVPPQPVPPQPVPPPPAGAPVAAPDPTVRMAAPRESPGEPTRLMRPVAPPSAPAPVDPTKGIDQ